ncbi:methyltransferase [Arthrobacter cryoconiti]
MNENCEHDPMSEPAPTAWQLMAPVIDLLTPMATRVAATLRVADFLCESPLSAQELARLTDSDPDAIGRLLRHLVDHGVFAEPKPDVFALNELGALLCSDHASGMRVQLDLTGFGGQMDLAFTGLLHTVRTGQPAWERVFGAPFWDFLGGDPVMSASFDATMTAGAEYLADDAQAFEWSSLRRIIDVGGGNGALLGAIISAHPDIQTTLVDLSETVERGRDALTQQGLAARCTFVGQSFFDPLPVGGEMYVLNSVLHDWGDKEAIAILRRCREAAGADGRVLIIETGAGEGAGFAEMDLRMLVLCGGKERTFEGYTKLATAAELGVISTHTTPLGQIVIECAAEKP